MPDNARGRLLRALAEAGWTVLPTGSPASRAPENPVAIDVRRGRTRRPLLVYSWSATPEGAGRTRHDQGTPKYRVQTTRSHDGDLVVTPGRSSLGIGWRQDWDVFFAFDLWTKRFAGRSSSVFVEPDLLQMARDRGTAAHVAKDCAQFAFTPSHVDHLFAWTDRLATEPRTVPLTVGHDEVQFLERDHARAAVDKLRARVTWLRPGDYAVLYDHRSRRIGDELWRVRNIHGQRVGSGANRVTMRLDLERWGVVHTDEWLST